MIMWANSHGKAGVKIADPTSMFLGSPSDPSVKPCGVFSHELAATMLAAPSIDTNGIGTPVQRCARGLSRSQP